MRVLSSLTVSDPASVIWGLALHHTTKPSAQSCSLLPTHLCPFDWRAQWQIVRLRSQAFKRKAVATAKVLFFRLTTPLVQLKEGSPPNTAQTPFQLQGMSPVGPLQAPQCHRALDTPLLWVPSTESSPGCAPSPKHKFVRDFLSISTFFRGFSGCQSAATTLRRKPPVGRMLISAGRQEGGAQLGSQSKSNQELTAPPALLPSCQEPGRACQEPPLHPPCAPSPSCSTTLPTDQNRGHFPQSPLRHSHLPPELFYTLRCSFSLFRWL